MNKLQILYQEFISAGYTQFFIDGIGGPVADDVDCLGCFDGIWEVYYKERGQKSIVSFSTPDMQKAIEFYRDRISGIQHWHLIAFTRLEAFMLDYKQKMESLNIKTIQNDIPNYRKQGDYVYRIFVVNGDIFKAKKIYPDLPLMDDDL